MSDANDPTSSNDPTVPAEIAGLYDEWAQDYDAAHVDWRGWVVEHGALLADALAERGVAPPAAVYDCTCGIGTQAIGLALAGYTVTGTDISAGEIDRARREAVSFGVEVSFEVADLLDPPPRTTLFDAVVSANSLTHFHDRATLDRAVATMAASVRPGGIVVVTNRDYDTVAVDRPTSTPVRTSVASGRQRISFQLWEWDATGDSYRMDDVLLTAPVGSDSWTVRHHTTRLRAWRRADIERAATAAGLSDFGWSDFGWSDFGQGQAGAQPIFTARRPKSSTIG